MPITVLGPTQVDGTGSLSPRERVVLEVLVAHRGTSVTTEQIADALWGESAPSSQRKVVQTAVMKLRKILGAESVETSAGGYRLKVAPGDVDAWRFADLVEHAGALAAVGELDRAVYALDDALAQWHGDPLQDLDGWPLATAEVARLHELHRLAEEQRLEALVQLGRHDDAIVSATALAIAEPLRERRWELLALALYRSGRQGEALRALSRARVTLREELGIDPRPELAALESAILDQDPLLAAPAPGALATVSERCPYKGLESYDVDDSESFFGRDTDVVACRERLAEAGVLVVTGGSGSGKSSLVRAGLVPELAAAGRAVAILVPGADPVASVAAAIASAAPDAVLVIDQAEELFTVCASVEARVRFVAAVEQRARRAPVVIVLRADHLGSTAAHTALRRMVVEGLYLLGPMTEVQLREAIEGPARQAGLRLEPGLVDVLLRDVVDEPGALPLLSHALAETWARREGRVLTVAGYSDTGGVIGAVARTAENLYAALPEDEQATTRAFLLRLIDVGEDGAPVRHRVPRTSIADESQRHVIDTLLRARLLTADEETLEIAHEALARAWPRLREWLDDDREGQRIRQHLTAAATGWDALGRDATELYRGARLDGALEWARSSGDRLTPAEQAFLTASVAAQQEDVRAHRHVARRLRVQIAGLSVLLVVALVAASVAVAEQRSAIHHASRADDAARAARTSELATLARTLPARQVDLALLLGLQARRLEHSIQTEAALEAALARTPTGLDRVFRLDSPTLGPGVAPDGRLLAVPRADGSVQLLSLPALEEVRVLRGRAEPAAVARFSPDGSKVVVGGVGGSVHVWNTASGRLEGVPLETGGDFAWGFVDPAVPGRVFTLTAIGARGTAVLWDRADPARPEMVGAPFGFSVQRSATPVAAISSDGSLLAVGDFLPGTGRTAVFDVQSRALVRQIDEAPGEFVPGTHTLATVGIDRVTLRSAATGLAETEPLSGLDTPSGDLVFSADGSRLAVVDFVRGILVFDLGTRRQLGGALGLDSGDAPVAFLADGRLVTHGSGAIGLWRLGVIAPPFAVAFDAYSRDQWVTGKLVAGTDALITQTWGPGAPVELLRWNARTGQRAGQAAMGEARLFFSVSPDGRYLAAPSLSDPSRFGVWDLATNEHLASFGDRAGTAALAYWSPAGDAVVTNISGERRMVVWDVSDPRHPVPEHELVLEGESPPGIVDFVVIPYWTDDGRFIGAVDTARPEVVMFDVATGSEIWRSPPLSKIGQVAFSPDGRTVAVASDRFGSSVVTLWPMGEWDRPRSLVLPGSSGRGVEFLRRGDVLVTTSEVTGDAGSGVAGASGAQLWNATTLAAIGEPVIFPASGAIYLNRDATGSRVVVGSGSGRAFVWDVDVNHWEDIACRIAGRNLTQSEWTRYLPDEPYRATCSEWPAGA